MTVLDRAPDRPVNLMALADQLLEMPSKAHADAFCDAIFSFTDWPEPAEGWPSRFMRDTEWAWREGRTAIGDL